MEEHKVTDNRLYIPENVPLRWELLRGFGFRELMQSAVIVAAGAVGALLYYKFSRLSLFSPQESSLSAYFPSRRTTCRFTPMQNMPISLAVRKSAMTT